MKNTFKAKLLALAVAALPLAAQAFPAFEGGTDNEIFFRSVENWVDADADGLISTGDYFYGIISAQNIVASGVDTWGADNVGSAPFDSFSGYFLQQVTNVTITGTVAGLYSTALLSLGSYTGGADPFGVFTAADLASGAQLKLFTDTTTKFENNGDVADDIAKATDGTLWGTLGLTSLTDYWYANALVDPNAAFGNTSTVGTTLAGLSFITNNSGKEFNLINDPSESLFDTNVDLYANTEIVDLGGPNGTNAWRFQVNDPAVLNVIPEPGSLALVGLGLMGFGMARRKKA